MGQPPTAGNGDHILKLTALLLLLFPMWAGGADARVRHEDYTSGITVAYRDAEAEAGAQAQAKVGAPQGYGGDCVTFAKRHTGVWGTWGNGGRKLSLNSGPRVGAVVVFSYTHVAVVVADNGLALTVVESNYIARDTVGYRTLLKSDPTIRGYHSF